MALALVGWRRRPAERHSLASPHTHEVAHASLEPPAQPMGRHRGHRDARRPDARNGKRKRPAQRRPDRGRRPRDECGFHGLPGEPPPFGGAYPVPEDYRGDYPPADYYTHLCGPLENDSDPNGDPLTWEVVTPPSHGDVAIFDETLFGYRPLPDYSTKPGDVAGGTWDSDSFTYHASDGQAYSNVATWRYWVMPVNDPPTYSAGERRVGAPGQWDVSGALGDQRQPRAGE